MRKQTRVEFLCGGRVIRQARADFETLSTIALSLKASAAETPGLVTAQSEQLRDAIAARKRLEGELAVHNARALYDSTPATAGGVRVAVIRRDAGSLEELRPLAQAFAALPKAALIAAVASPATVLLAASEDSGVDAGAVLKAALTSAAGRGGGAPRLAQGSVPSAGALDAVLTSVQAAFA
jgi:alanyl-tRNA synthetase